MMTTYIKENNLNSSNKAYIKKSQDEKETSENNLLFKKKNKRNNSVGIIIFIIILFVVGIYCWSNYSPVSYLTAKESVTILNDGSTIELALSTDAENYTLCAISEDTWVKSEISDNYPPKLLISAEVNSGESRRTSIEVIAHSSFFGHKLSKQVKRIVTVEQQSGYASYLNVSKTELEFSTVGGTETIQLDTDGIVAISTEPYSWGHVRINGNEIIVKVDENTNNQSRTDYFIIKSGTKEKRINISQAGKIATYLSVSDNSVSFGASGGSRVIEVLTDGSWEIGTGTYSWGHTSINGNNITLRIDANNGDTRTDYFVIKAGEITQRVNISQDAKSATYLNTSPKSVSFRASGGSRTINVSTDGRWSISTSTASWGHTSINGNTITLRVDANNGDARTDYFVLKSGTKEARINISQEGKSTTYLRPSQSEISVSHKGGRRTITVSCDGNWKIGTPTASWIELSKSGNTLTLDIERNNSTNDRDDYFTIKSGNLEKRINITQFGDNTPNADIERIWVDHNIVRGYGYGATKGMVIHVEFDVENLKNQTVTVQALFYYGDNTTPLNNGYGGQVSVSDTGNVNHDSGTFEDFKLYLPYPSLRMMGHGSGVFSFDVLIKDRRGNTLDRKNNIQFTYYQ